MAEKLKKHQHVTPRVYLRRFATAGQLMAQRPGAEPMPLGVPEVAVRTHFYTVRLQDGSRSNMVENSLADLENDVAYVFGSIDREHLPLNASEKAVLAEFLGTQMARGMGYRLMRSSHIQNNEAWIRNHVKELFLNYAPEDRAWEADAFARDYDLGELTVQNEEVRALLSTGHTLANSLANMQWTFVRFRRPVLLSGDQPVVCWLGPHRADPWAVLPSREIRVPLDPVTVLVATWHDGPDPDRFVPGDLPYAMSVNHFTKKQSVDWVYWVPGMTPRAGLPTYDEGIAGPRPKDTRRAKLTTDLVQHILATREEGITMFVHASQAAS